MSSMKIDSSPGRWTYATSAVGGGLASHGTYLACTGSAWVAVVIAAVGALLLAIGMMQCTDGARFRRYERRRVALIRQRRAQQEAA